MHPVTIADATRVCVRLYYRLDITPLGPYSQKPNLIKYMSIFPCLLIWDQTTHKHALTMNPMCYEEPRELAAVVACSLIYPSYRSRMRRFFLSRFVRAVF